MLDVPRPGAAYAARIRKAGMVLVAVALVATGYVVEELSDREPAPVVDTAPARPGDRPLGPLCVGPMNLDSPSGCVDPEVEPMTPPSASDYGS